MKAPAVLLLLVALVFAGCASSTPPAPAVDPRCADLNRAFGESLGCLKGTTLLPPDLVRIRATKDPSGTWGSAITASVVQPGLVMAPWPADPRDPGDADRVRLDAPRGFEIEAGFAAARQLSAYKATWLVTSPEPCDCPGGYQAAVVTEAPASANVTFTVHGPGTHQVLAFLRPFGADADEPAQAVMIAGPRITLDAVWFVEGTVFPLRLQGQSALGAEAMADSFVLGPAWPGGEVSVQLTSRATAAPSGKDTGLALLRDEGRPVVCRNHAEREEGQPSAFTLEASASTQSLGTSPVVRVGVLPPQCGVADYENVGPVPYALTITLRY